ncbi:uncharacterized protein [Antedon mediterranea]|uniref:uncharacterized protein n=1 Tax=Antedon mediterranea TaxID=105859 RepID=UPI003AF98406
MFWMWSVSLVLLWTDTSNGNTNPIQCYSCSKCDDCSKAPLITCFNDQDVCAIVATWDGNLYNPLKIAKQCDAKSHCPPDFIDTNETYCDVTADGVRCISCCTGSGCNDGALGDFPIPPPMTPIQKYKFDDCGDSTNCEISANVVDNVINVNKFCDKPLTNGYAELERDNDKCNIQNDSDMCVTCCETNCFKSTSDSQRTSCNLLLIVMLGFFSLLLIRR